MQEQNQIIVDDGASRKADHIELAFKSQVDKAVADKRFYYEPMLRPHPKPDEDLPITFLGKELRFPLWVSSMTGGTEMAKHINTNLARMCAEFGLGMGLGSCRALLDSHDRLSDFDMRDIIGVDLPLYANLGIAQVEELLENGNVEAIEELVLTLRADGLIVHINPLQEWTQPEGDRINRAPIETVRELVTSTQLNIVVKEVGQGFGPRSIGELLKLPIQAIEMAAHGGTNFTKLELLRASSEEGEAFAQMTLVGHTAEEMAGFINGAAADLGNDLKCREVIISGGLKGFLDGYYIMNRLNLPSIYGHASMFLKYAKDDYESLQRFAKMQIEGLKMANSCLEVR